MRATFAKGQTAIALSLALPVLVGAACLGGDSAMVYRERIALQASADYAALKGAAYLPGDPVRAARVAQRYVEQSGLTPPVKVIYDRVSADHSSLTLVVRRSVRYAVGGWNGHGQDAVIASATATVLSTQLPTPAAGAPNEVAQPPSTPLGAVLSRDDPSSPLDSMRARGSSSVG